jgi:hypothetical protein
MLARRCCLIIACALVARPAMAGSGELRLTMRDGLVTLVARDVTVRQILTEWSRVGRTRVVNIERIPGGPVTIELTNLPESKALDIILRSLAGFVAAPRAQTDPNASRFDRILVMPQLAAAAPAATAGSPRATALQPSMGMPPGGDGRGRAPWSPRGMPGAQGIESLEQDDEDAGSEEPQDMDPEEETDTVPGRFPGVRPGLSSAAVGTAASPGMVVPLPADTRRLQGGKTPDSPVQPPRSLVPPKPPGRS